MEPASSRMAMASAVRIANRAILFIRAPCHRNIRSSEHLLAIQNLSLRSLRAKPAVERNRDSLANYKFLHVIAAAFERGNVGIASLAPLLRQLIVEIAEVVFGDIDLRPEPKIREAQGPHSGQQMLRYLRLADAIPDQRGLIVGVGPVLRSHLRQHVRGVLL